MLITILDVETTGLDPEKDEVIEVAAILYSTEHRAILQQVSTLLLLRATPEGSCNPINGIDYALCGKVTRDIEGASLDLLREMEGKSSYLVAFNSDFDRQWFDGVILDDLEDDPRWADAAAITYPQQSTKRDLVNIALANGIPVVNAHRALDDCRLVAELLGKVPDLEAQLERAARPKATVIALVSYDDRQLAKDAGFVWDSLVSKAWAKRMPLEDAEALPFPVTVPTVSAVVLG